ncbi:hypothetical protein GWI33_011500 [Rhynchophorus ferrugineus]|uniref:Uncharacterized protein n=1 Tax=Rhynchophorus ferrugineus TaxID=354439 RepID=A0A834MBI2_RHYFE|nr:hypothetical protein GWI33_011500 [Rhynchophorus ferrugineus]
MMDIDISSGVTYLRDALKIVGPLSLRLYLSVQISTVLTCTRLQPGAPVCEGGKVDAEACGVEGVLVAAAFNYSPTSHPLLHLLSDCKHRKPKPETRNGLIFRKCTHTHTHKPTRNRLKVAAGLTVSVGIAPLRRW